MLMLLDDRLSIADHPRRGYCHFRLLSEVGFGIEMDLLGSAR